jgi:hypothetical protein
MFYKVCAVILSWETFAGKLFRKKCRDIFPGNFGRNFPRKSFLPFCENAGDHPLGETLCDCYTLCVHNTRLESISIEKHNILCDKTLHEIFPTGSFRDFPKFSGGKFSRREVSRISRNSPWEIFPTGSFPDFPEFSVGNFPDGKFPGFPDILILILVYDDTFPLVSCDIITTTCSINKLSYTGERYMLYSTRNCVHRFDVLYATTRCMVGVEYCVRYTIPGYVFLLLHIRYWKVF